MNRYSFLNEAQAISLVEAMMPKTADLKGVVPKTFLTDLAILDSVDGIVVLGFEDKYTYDVQTKLSVLVEKGLSYNINIYFNTIPPKEWDEFEIFPKTPSHF